MRKLVAILAALLLPVLLSSCQWLDRSEMTCTHNSDAACIPVGFCNPIPRPDGEHYCDGTRPGRYLPDGDDDDSSGDDDDTGDDDTGDDDTGDDDSGDDDTGDDDTGDDDTGDDDSGDDDTGDDDDYKWVPSSSSVTGTLNSVSFPTRDIGWVVGDAGVILHTTDSGLTWSPQHLDGSSSPSPIFTGELTSVSFLPDGENGWITSTTGEVLNTADGGIEWHTTTVAGDVRFNSIYARAPDQIYAVGEDAPTGEGSLYAYLLGSDTWQDLLLGGTYDDAMNAITSTPNDGFNPLFWAVGDSGTFAMSGAVSYETAIGGSDLHGVAIVNGSNGWIVGDEGRLDFTTSAGLVGSWEPRPHLIPEGFRAHDLYDIAFVGIDHGWIAGQGGLIIRTTDGGGTWLQDDYSQVQPPPNPQGNHILDIEFFDEVAGWAVGEGGLIMRTVPIDGDDDDDTGDDDDDTGDDDDSSAPICDADADGHLMGGNTPAGQPCNGDDCNDTDPGTHPGATEINGNDIDEDCDGVALCFQDLDSDAFGSMVTVPLAAVAGVTAPLTCDDHMNNRADDSTDCNDNFAAFNPADADGDGYSTCDSPPDCDDSAAVTHPGAAQLEGNGSECMTDADDDGFGDDSPTDPQIMAGSDCDDSDPFTHPGVWDATTFYEGISGGQPVDQDCDGSTLTTSAAVSAIGFTSECSFTNHDFMVGPAGDFTGNGMPDLVFGDPGWSASACILPNEAYGVGGRSYLWRSRAAAGAGDDLPLIGQSTQLGSTGTDGAYLTGGIDMHSGYSVALGGDINNDGFSDMLISAPGGRVGNHDAGGVVYLVLGRASGPSAALTAEGLRTISPFLGYANGADFTFYSDGLGDKTGETIAWAGDIDNDTYDEILIGAPGYDGNKGRVYLLNGADITGAMDGSATAISCTDGSNPVANCMHLPTNLPSNTTFTGVGSERLGVSLAAGKDLSRDGLPDLAFGAPYGGDGTVYVVLSHLLNDSTTVPLWGGTYNSTDATMSIIDAEMGNAEFGHSLSMIADLPSDSESPAPSCCAASSCSSNPLCTESAELLVGSPATLASTPKAWIVHGSTIMDELQQNTTNLVVYAGNPYVTFFGDQPNTGFGLALATGDIDGDSYPDILICDPEHADGGRGYLYSGGSLSAGDAKSPEQAYKVFGGESPDDRFCASATFPGNVDGTAHGDLLIAAPGWNGGIGKGYLFLSN